ncbi:MAG: 4a-hydroxytetrahydrobiopterin dehydratase [Minisyncoccota bacterium]
MKNGWIEADNALQKTFHFKNFKEALAFVNKVGEIAENLQHHPDICIKDYKSVFISTTTHDQGSAVTAKDHEIVARIDTIAP